ncbi:MAG TPA: hypothetical protein VGQ05_19040, partial [Streptosporangiaceae bacterium]|nr:hypothetical protein [Streptosporangiaceae bacterium]
PGCPPIEGVEQFVGFYRRRCIVSAGRHHVDRSMAAGEQGFCWGRFDGMSHAGVPLNEIFADWFEFRGGRIARRRRRPGGRQGPRPRQGPPRTAGPPRGPRARRRPRSHPRCRRHRHPEPARTARCGSRSARRARSRS